MNTISQNEIDIDLGNLGLVLAVINRHTPLNQPWTTYPVIPLMARLSITTCEKWLMVSTSDVFASTGLCCDEED